MICISNLPHSGTHRSSMPGGWECSVAIDVAGIDTASTPDSGAVFTIP
ncbi:hypothetical protein OPR95_001735 [Enterococcus hirae]|nr:hypothetical protein [Enterococcus hirae]EMF0159408.1 hypothetical protein [Enterococcus hirae]